MLTRDNKIGLVLAFLLALADISFVTTLGGDSADQPPAAAVWLSVLVGLVSVVLVVLAWRAPTWPVMITIIGLRALSALADIPGFFQTAAIATVSVVHLIVSLVCIWLLRNWIRRPAQTTPRSRAGATS